MRLTSRGQVITVFALDMVPRVLVVVVAVVILGNLYRAIVAPPTIGMWDLLVTLVVSVALARVTGALLIVTAASVVDGGPTSLTTQASRDVAIRLASPKLLRFYLARLALYLFLGVVLGLLLVVLDVFGASRPDAFGSFITGPMVGVIYGYLATGWELARATVAVTPARTTTP